MTCFLTSSTVLPGTDKLAQLNGLADGLRAALPQTCHGLYICSDPDDFKNTDFYARLTKESFEGAGFTFTAFDILDGRTVKHGEEYIRAADLIVLTGGHVPTQNRFFQNIGLGQLLQGYKGVVVGISAGSMNSAEEVYAHPELEGEAIDPAYERFLPGLGLTRVMIIPHYQMIQGGTLDGLRLFEDIAYPDSMGRQFYVLPDGSYLYGKDGAEELRGKAYRIQDGVMEQVCEDGQVFRLSKNNPTHSTGQERSLRKWK